MEPLNTYREGTSEIDERLPNLHVFMHTNVWTGDYAVISIRTEISESGALLEAATIFADNKKDKGAVSELSLTEKLNELRQAEAGVQVAEADLHSAELDLEFTEVRAPLEGYVTNLNLQIGSHTVENQPAMALVDISSYYIYGFFKETQIENIKPGDKVVVKLMSYPDKPLEGEVNSIGWGIAQQDGSTSVDLLPSINPSFDWIRLAQRIPVRVHLTRVPVGVTLRLGTTATVIVLNEQ